MVTYSNTLFVIKFLSVNNRDLIKIGIHWMTLRRYAYSLFSYNSDNNTIVFVMMMQMFKT